MSDKLRAAAARLTGRAIEYYRKDLAVAQREIDIVDLAEAYLREHPEDTVHHADDEIRFRVGSVVQKTGGDYRFVGTVVAAFTKGSGVIRYVVENGDGLLHIFSEAQLAAVVGKAVVG